MSTDLYPRTAQDVEELVIAWLAEAFTDVAIERRPNDPLPFRRVQHVAGTEELCTETAEAVVSVHTLCSKALGWRAASLEAQETHQRMLELGCYTEAITLSDDSEAYIDDMDVFMSPTWTEYTDDIIQKTGRYSIRLTYQNVIAPS